jgi:virulence-associated protein VagC
MVAYTYVYAGRSEVEMQRTAKIFMNNRSQAVRLPKEFQFKTSEVFIRKQGDEVILSARPKDWSAYLAWSSWRGLKICRCRSGQFRNG